MSQEIVFTSSERGLRAGSTGFCTVRSTVGMPQNLASLLEQLTGYMHPYDAYDRSLFDKHPVNFAHYISRVGGQRFHILCRICNAPLDHTNRSNKLAHLIAFEEGEIDLSHTQGPAAAIHWMIPPAGKKQEPGDSRYWITSWPSDQKPCVLPDSNRLVLPSVNDKPGPCTVWKQVLGDSGWAAVLAESIQDRKRQSVPVVFSSDQKDKCLDLVQEALSLLPPAERWGVTFSTFQSGSLPTKVECRWQFLLDSTDLAQKAIRNQHRTPVIDLTSLKGMQLPASELAAFTNSGKRPWDKASVSLSRPSAPKQPAAVPPKLSAASAPSVEDHDEDLDSRPGGYSLRAPDSRPGPRPGRVKPVRRNRKRPPSRRLIAVAGTIIVLGGIAVWAYPHFRTKQNDESNAVVETAVTDNYQSAGAVTLSDSSTTPVASPDRIQSPPVRSQDPQIPSPDTESTSTQSTITMRLSNDTPSNKPPENESSATPPPSTPKPFDDLRGMQSRIPDLLNMKPRKPVILSASVNVDPPSDCEITLTHNKAVEQSGFKIKLDRKDRDGKSEWTVTGNGTTATDISTPIVIGVFTLEDKKLSFQFSKSPQLPLPDVFLETAILISHAKKKDEQVLCQLGRPDTQQPLRLTDTNRALLSKARIGYGKEQFALRCKIDGLPEGYKQDKEFELSNAVPKNVCRFTREAKIGTTTVTYLDIEVSLIETDQGDIAVQCKQLIKYVKADFNKDVLPTTVVSDGEFNASEFKNNVEEAKEILATYQGKLNTIQQQLKEKEEALEKAPKDGKISSEVKNLRKEESKAEKAVKFATDWVAWSNEVDKQRSEIIKNVTIHYKLRRDGSVPEDEQAILVQTEGFE